MIDLDDLIEEAEQKFDIYGVIEETVNALEISIFEDIEKVCEELDITDKRIKRKLFYNYRLLIPYGKIQKIISNKNFFIGMS